jgi:predicted nucleic acid-binding protein
MLLYMYSSADAGKQLRARELYREYSAVGRVVLGTQVVQEFFVAALRKLALPRQFVREITTALLDSNLIIVESLQIRTAMDLEERQRISFGDALIIAAAQSAGAEVLFTEDLNDGQRYGSVAAQNPFCQR